MDKLILLIKVLTITQFVLIIVFLILGYLMRLYYYYRKINQAKRAKWVFKLLLTHLKKKEPFSEKTISYFKKSIDDVLKSLTIIQKRKSKENYFFHFKKQLSDLVLKPVARQWQTSKIWHKRYTATLCYAHGFDKDDENNLIVLLNDPSALIAVNVAKIIIECSPKLVQEVITTFAKKRRLQQTLFLENIKFFNQNISTLVLERLENEQVLYTKIFCYRLLSEFPQETISNCVGRDLNHDSIDMKIAILKYLKRCKGSERNELIYGLAVDPSWEIRAAAAKVLGDINTDTSLEILTSFLVSKDWWVRRNAAYSLYLLGEKGIAVLKDQSPKKDKFAYETALSILIEKDKFVYQTALAMVQGTDKMADEPASTVLKEKDNS